jgi:arylsulfatase A-like enzyme
VWRELEPRNVQEATACYYATCSAIDREVGRALRALEETGQAENTVVVFMSDHGDMLGAHGLFTKGVPAYEDVYRIPLIIAGPGVQRPGRTATGFANTVDLASTILDLAGAEAIDDVDGRSLRPLLEDSVADVEASPWAEGFAEFHGQRLFYTQRIVWHGRHKYIFNGYDFDELYDLGADPLERRNLAQDPASQGVLEDMATRMWRRVHALGDYNLYETNYPMFRFAPVGPLAGRG